MTQSNEDRSATRTPVAEDPHPGSNSDGTHPAARESRQPRAGKESKGTEPISGTGAKPAIKSGVTPTNREAPRHPHKGAYGS